MTEVYLAILVLTPLALTFFLKSNAALAFLALCGGFAVTTLSGSDIQHLIGQTRITSLTSNDVDLTLLAAPLLFTLILTYRSVTGKARRYWQMIPAACAGGLLAVIAAPMISDTMGISVTNSRFWQDLQNIQSYIIGLGLLFSLLLVWSAGFKHPRSHSKKHK